MRKSLYFKRILGFTIIFSAIVTSVVVVRYFTGNAQKDTNTRSDPQSTDISMKTIYFTESHQNRKKWELFAQSGIHDKANELTSLKDIRFIVERDPKNGPITVTARSGQYRHKTKTVHLEGDVLAKTANGMTFTTAKIEYDSAEKVFTTQERIRLTDAALTVEGVGMDVYNDRQQAIVKSRVEAVIYPGKRVK
jgi:LPS export ABC transporter protein LptC